MDIGTDGQIGRKLGGWSYEQMDRQIGRQVDGQPNRWIDR
jgi:hypothetical protein